MKCSKQFYILSIFISILVCSIAYADTCYDPNYDSYYNCAGDEYVAPVVGALLFGAIISNNNGYGNHDHHNHDNGNHGNRGGFHSDNGHGGGSHGGNGHAGDSHSSH